ncbi:MAG TPA: MOSC domain-containing protein [Micropepsaceae bacterium]|nr:MOSC domain-containing protein [Micropepsaceae bacterium]
MGRLVGIARATAKRAPLAELGEAEIGLEHGIPGDGRGRKTGRQVTVLFREGWEDACRELGVNLPWVMRRANLLVVGVAVPRAGGQLVIGGAVLEVTEETKPCQVMETAHRGLRRALEPAWRGGVCCRVVRGGCIRVGDTVDIA